VSEIPAHLGGFTPGGDEATIYPRLWQWLVSEVGVESVLDVGAGEGIALDFLAGIGVEAVGVDGVDLGHPKIIVHDFTTGPCLASHALDVDLVWCCEFVEHVEERFLPNFLPMLACGHLVALTHADPGQPGHHHVNCRPAVYWQGVMAAAGYVLDEQLTRDARAQAAANPSPWNHFLRSGLMFRRYA
jgi:2-polyprenyl-3-methyl-5-hydroxy-6-metoxy-1,4-benzoquinol methylase